MNISSHISPEDLSLFALQFLTPEETTEAVSHLEHCEECRTELGRTQGDLVAYAMTAEMHSPPALARERLMRRVAKEKKLIAIDRSALDHSTLEPLLVSRESRGFIDDDSHSRGSAIGWFGWLGWAAAAGIAIFGGLQFHYRQGIQHDLNAKNARIAVMTEEAARSQTVLQALTDSGSMQVALHLPSADPNEAPRPQGEASYIPDSGSLVFVASHLPPLQSYKTYELWVLPADGHDPVAAGTFKPDAHGNASVMMPDIPKGVAASGFGVTIEDDGGSKQGPTKPIVLVGIGA